jgi:hypothetical protein
VKRVEHEAIAAERDEHLGLVRLGETVATPEQCLRGCRYVRVRREKPDSSALEVDRLLLLAMGCVRVQPLLLVSNDMRKIRGSALKVTVPFRGARL